MIMTLEYIIVCSLCIACVVWMIWHVLLTSKNPGSNGGGGGGGGGIPTDFVFPSFDPPSGHGLDAWLTDRMPAGFEEESPSTHRYQLQEQE